MTFRKAKRSDVPEIVKLLSDDPLGRIREQYSSPLPEVYYTAFDKINSNENEMLLVIEDPEAPLAEARWSWQPGVVAAGGDRPGVAR